MLFVALFKALPATAGERVRRRLELGSSEDTPVVAEYWLQSPDPASVVVCEAAHFGQLWELFGAWDDLFEITIVPAIEAREGLEVVKQMQEEGAGQ
jgi:hypothetical protein